MKLPKLLARNSLYDCSIGEERVGMVASQILVLRKSCREIGSAVGATQSQMLDQVDRAAPAFAKVRDLYLKIFRLGERVKEGAVAFKKATRS